MQYFGIPQCPYCKKRVNLIRTWSLKRQGEYQCPRCGGISNIFLSPLVYVFALLAVFSGGAVYFFHKFILDDIGLTTCFQVLLPFAVFFLLSLFLVYLAKPVIKRVPREEAGRKKQPAKAAPTGAKTGVSGQTGRIYADREEYLPQSDYRTGPFPQEAPVQAPSPQPVREQAQPTAVMAQEPPTHRADQLPPRGQAQRAPAAQRRRTAQQTAAQRSVSCPAPSGEEPTQARVASIQEGTGERTVRPPLPRTQRPQSAAQAPAPRRTIQEPRQASRVVSSVELPSVDGDFFAKYDDPAYVERRLKELQEKQDQENS